MKKDGLELAFEIHRTSTSRVKLGDFRWAKGQTKVGMGMVWLSYGEGLLWLEWRAAMTIEKVNKVN